MISAVHDHGGDVLKLIGDGVLAVFTGENSEMSCESAMAAETTLRHHLTELNRRRAADGLPITDAYPAVNEVSRIAAMCRSVDRGLLVSEAFADSMSEAQRTRLVSVGRYALRGVEQPQHLYTREPLTSI